MMVANGSPASEDALHRLLAEDATDYAVHMIDPDGLVASWNAGAQRLNGYAAEEAIGRPCSTLYCEEDQAAGVLDLALATALKEGGFEAEGWRRRKDGGRFWARTVIQPIRDVDDAPVGFVMITHNLAEKNRARRERD
jgi:PAS domain S-box-containing protein